MDASTIVIKNWDHYKSLIKHISRKNSLEEMLNKCSADESDSVIAPASTKEEFTRCFPGGYAEHQLNIVRNMIKLKTAYEITDSGLKDSVLIVGLFSEVAKLGTKELGPYYLPETNKYLNEKGVRYQVAEDYRKLSVAGLSLKTLSNHIDLTIQEWNALFILDSRQDNARELYATEDSELSLLLRQSIARACMTGRGRKTPTLTKLTG